MRGRIASGTVVAGLLALTNFSAPSAADASAPSLVDHTEWARFGGSVSLRIYPTPLLRAAAARLDADAAEQAWHEVLSGAPDADTPGMRAQFLCHWQFAEFARPGKTSWNLEPWRPVVDDATMVGAGCNPGGAEEAL